MTTKVELSQNQTDFLKANASIYRHDWEEAFFLPFIYTRDPEDDEENVYTIIPLKEATANQLRILGEENIFNVAQMKNDAIEFFKWNALKVDGYVKYIEQIKPLVTSNEIDEALNTFEGSTLEERYELYLQSKGQVV